MASCHRASSFTNRPSVMQPPLSWIVQSSRERALVSAPPGFSEHHTGYALDICDETLTLDESFASTKAYAWLQMNARAYNFELSFPERGKVAFEPWHWRFEGETEAIEAFYGR